MIAMAGVVGLRFRPEGRRWWIPLPLFLVWLILLPLAVIWVPVVLVVSLAVDLDPLRIFGVAWQVLAGLRNLRVQVDQRDASVLVIFI